ncbi:MAG TPA: VWA domain-containing protein [Thermoanaerobaculia bacterium]|jgi:VWFA-related protein|nr:VWA domain-containing protein [Thermoanaerobaculia bacterium]
MKALCFAFLLAVVAVTAAAQEVSESIEVRVVNVDVVVRDRAGKPVTGLTKNDFEIYENGQKREITNLYEVRAPAVAPAAAASAEAAPPPATPTATPVEIRPRNIVIFVDNYSIEPFRRDKVLQSLDKFVDQLGPQDKVMLVLETQKTTVVTPFTSDRNAIRAGVEMIKKSGSSYNRTTSLDHLKQTVNEYIAIAKGGRLSWRDAYREATSDVESHVEEEIFNSRNTLAALGQVTAALAGLEGKNVVIFAGAHLPERPGAELYQWLYNAFVTYMAGLTFSSESVSGKTGSMQHYSIEEAAKQASANGVALYMIDAADSRDAGSAEATAPIDHAEQFTAFTNTAMAYQTLARISGGLAITNTTNFDSAFQTLVNDLNSYYSLGFKPADNATAGLRTIVVKMKNPEYRFRARETYIPTTKPVLDEMSTRVIANLYTTDARNAWEISVQPGPPQKEGAEYRVPFEVTMAPTITLEAKDGNLVGNFVVFVVVGNAENTSKVIRNAHAVKVPVDAEDDFREKKITYKATITMNPGDNILSVAVVDQASKMAGFARAKVALP